MEKNNHPKILVYKGIIQYILDSTHYTLKNIADLSDSSLDNIRAIYCHNSIPNCVNSEMRLIKLYQIVLEINAKSHSLAS